MEEKYINKEDDKFILDEIKYELFRPIRKRNRLIRLFKLYAFMGVLLFILGSLYFVITLIDFDLTSEQRIALILTVVGLILSLLSYFSVNYLRETEKNNIIEKEEFEKKKRKFEEISHFLFLWSELEQIVNQLSSYSSDYSRYSIKQNLEVLLREGRISEMDFLNIEKALRLRNEIVHISPNQIGDLRSGIDNITQILKKMELKMKSL